MSVVGSVGSHRKRDLFVNLRVLRALRGSSLSRAGRQNPPESPLITVSTVGLGRGIEAGLAHEHALQRQQGGARIWVEGQG